MRRTFIATEVVETRYVYNTNEVQEERIKEIGYANFIKEVGEDELMEEALSEQIVDFIETLDIKEDK